MPLLLFTLYILSLLLYIYISVSVDIICLDIHMSICLFYLLPCQKNQRDSEADLGIVLHETQRMPDAGNDDDQYHVTLDSPTWN